MATNDEVDAAEAEARLTLLKKITDDTMSPVGQLHLAEAYAYLTYPNVAHGSTQAKS